MMLINHICLLLEKKLQIFLTRVQIPFSFLTIMFAAKTVHADNGWCSHTGMSFHIYCQFHSVNSWHSTQTAFPVMMFLWSWKFRPKTTMEVKCSWKVGHKSSLQVVSCISNTAPTRPKEQQCARMVPSEDFLVWILEPLKGETSQTRIFLHTSKRAEKVFGGGANAHADRIHLY